MLGPGCCLLLSARAVLEIRRCCWRAAMIAGDAAAARRRGGRSSISRSTDAQEHACEQRYSNSMIGNPTVRVSLRSGCCVTSAGWTCQSDLNCIIICAPLPEGRGSAANQPNGPAAEMRVFHRQAQPDLRLRRQEGRALLRQSPARAPNRPCPRALPDRRHARLPARRARCTPVEVPQAQGDQERQGEGARGCRRSPAAWVGGAARAAAGWDNAAAAPLTHAHRSQPRRHSHASSRTSTPAVMTTRTCLCPAISSSSSSSSSSSRRRPSRPTATAPAPTPSRAGSPRRWHPRASGRRQRRPQQQQGGPWAPPSCLGPSPGATQLPGLPTPARWATTGSWTWWPG
jgi:hypothetical protein